jgi:hypothetical protein
VFIGGAIAPLLHTDPPFEQPRPTKDADAVTASQSYRDVEELHNKLRARGFWQDTSETKHIHRWRSPDGDAFDLVPAGAHLGGSGQIWDAVAIKTRVSLTLDDGMVIYHASAPAFLAMKWAAHDDRGRDDPLASHDLEDIFALIAARPTVVGEVRSAPGEVQIFIASKSEALMTDDRFEDLAAAHLNNAQDPVRTRDRVRERLAGLAAPPMATSPDAGLIESS